ncbi:HAD-IA family hydrolase [Pseudoalteromonas luteoviolacea]|uniref:HAD family hydrolase n=1 Tax=Pseudoalteromonas luteoviolacea TaxID=43657 RepID=UPI001EEE652B|nr:HAD-IA family hydrolase [Pseudoalteromonas luteoviolacea]MCF6442870.1 HAD-IA family hydrolase [Pseudoalteromonas luteoviolacea]
MDYKLVIFDWDGTVMDTVPKIVNTINKVADTFGFPRETQEKTQSIIGLSLQTALETLFPAQTHRSAELAEAYKTIYRDVDQTPTELFKGVEDVLQFLSNHNIKLAVATGKSRPGLDRLLLESGLGGYFDVTRTADEAESKPSPDMVQQILSELDIAPEQAVMIGDTTIDMDMARNAGVAAIGVTFGVANRNELAQYSPVHIIDEFKQLLTCLA